METAPLLEIQHITKKFGGLLALNEISLEIDKEKITSIIGTNGAGKSTLFNVITGMFPPTLGAVIFKGRDITGKRADYIVKQGIARSFQITNLFSALPVYENIRLASQSSKNRLGLIRMGDSLREVEKETREHLINLDLYKERHSLAGNLSHGDQRKLEIGLALATSPSLLLLDEPAAGLTAFETEGLIRLIKEISKFVTIVLIEHDMNVVMGISDKIVVMNQGHKLAEGGPEEIKRNEEVKRVYLGGDI